MATRLTDQHQKEIEEKKFLNEAQALTVKDHPMKVLPLEETLEMVKTARKKICDLLRRSLVNCVASKPAMMSLASCLTEPMVVASVI
jgi:hypothetical protein